jgi:thiamine transporter
MVLCALLDYLLAYTCLGFAGPIAGRFKNRTAGIAVGVALTGLARLACSLFSGWVLWGEYAWEGWPVWLYALAYNACWCLPDVALALIAALLLSRVKALGLRPAGTAA